MESKVYLYKNDNIQYPTAEYFFCPSSSYPEYLWGSENIASKSNDIYDSFRELLRLMELDIENFGKEEWNPFKSFVTEKGPIIIKPNMVISNREDNFDPYLDSVVTHPSLIKPMIDYILIADRKAEIIIADSPVLNCDFEKLIKLKGYDRIIDFYKNMGAYVSIMDLRIIKPTHKIKGKTSYFLDEAFQKNFTSVNLGKESEIKDIENLYKKFRVTSYNLEEIRKHQNRDIHEYMIYNKFLESGLIFNVPKLKTHRRAGLTCSLKNFIGANGRKDWLPHHIQGSAEMGGDEYEKKDFVKMVDVKIVDIINKHLLKAETTSIWIMNIMRRIIRKFFSKFLKDDIHDASWHGNKTIWRTIFDINKIMLYADKHGNISDVPQRKILTFTDMVVCGEGNGPIEPEPINLNTIGFSYNQVVFDTAVSRFMGFDYRKIPQLVNAYDIKKLQLTKIEPDDIEVISNYNHWNKNLNEIKNENILKFKPSKGWLNNIEL